MWRVVSSGIHVPLCKTGKEAVVLEQGHTVIVHKTSMDSVNDCSNTGRI